MDDAWVERCERAEAWAAEGEAALSVQDGAVHVEGVAARAVTALPSWLTGFVRVEVRYRSTAAAHLSLEAKGTPYQSCALPIAEGWTDLSCLLHLPALREEARLILTVTDGALDVDEIRLAPLQAEPSVALPAAGPLPSALDAWIPAAEPGAPVLGGEARRNLVRSKPFARPLVGLAVADGVAARLGGSVGHRWWTAAVLPVQAGGETALRLTAPVGAARGYRLDAWSSHGPWLGPVGLRLGPALRLDREVWDEVLPAALSVGGAADLGLDLGPIALSGGVMPLWPVAGDRAGLDLTLRGGVRVAFADVDLGLEVAHRSTAIGPIVDGTVAIGLRLP